MRRDDRSVLLATRSALLVATLAALTACQQSAPPPSAQGPSEVEWARAALERNPHLEIIAVDTSTNVFTVRDRRTGEIRAVGLDDLAAAPLELLAQHATSPTPHTAPIASPEEALATQAAPEAAPPALAPSEPSAPQASVADADDSSTDTAASYTIERSGGQIRISGPGVSIVSADTAGEGQPNIARGTPSEPIICEGKRMMHLDGRQIFVEGDAIVVRGGCELYVTNSRIVATGTSIVVHDGTVHVSNSTIDGRNGSFDVSDQARLIARASTFQGIPRRAEHAIVQDQGGNRWR